MTLQVTDNAGATGSVTQQVTVSAAPTGTMSIHDLSGSATPRKGGWTATVTITVHDGNGPVSGAMVSGFWSTGALSSCITDAAGTCSDSLNLNKKATSVDWTVSSITHATLTYVGTDPPASITIP